MSKSAIRLVILRDDRSSTGEALSASANVELQNVHRV